MSWEGRGGCSGGLVGAGGHHELGGRGGCSGGLVGAGGHHELGGERGLQCRIVRSWWPS
jgi:hypothetical protein